MEDKHKHIVFVWELGAGYGHVTGMRLFIEAMQASGYNVSLIVRYLDSTYATLQSLGIPMFQAPRYAGGGGKLDVTYSLPEIILRFGFTDAQQLLPVVKGWCDLYDLLAPDLVIIDHAPTATLACRAANLPFVTLGTGFFTPPLESPAPVFPGMAKPNLKRVKDNEDVTVQAINGVLRHFERPTIRNA